MEKLPTDVIFLLLAACPPPDYVNLAVALCHVIFRHKTRRLSLSEEKKIEWDAICFEHCVNRWQDDMIKTDSFRMFTQDKRALLISLFAKVLTDAKLDPLKNDFPPYDQVSSLLRHTTLRCQERDFVYSQVFGGV